jgi:WD40 repeat protein
VSPDGQNIAGAIHPRGQDSTLAVWEVRSGKEIFRHRTTAVTRIHSLSFAPNGHSLICSLDRVGGGEVKVWDIATGREEITLTGFYNGVTYAAISPVLRWS